MANRPRGYGMTAELNAKRMANYDTELEEEVVTWMEAVLGEPIADGPRPLGMQKFAEALKDGRHLCNLMNKISPGAVKKINDSKMAFKQMENIGKFLEASIEYGVNKVDSFQTVDLYEQQNVGQVINGIHALGRKAQTKGFGGPALGPKEASANKREFTEEQIREGQTVISLQMGSNKGASQAGDHFGRPRQVAGSDKYK